jgi:type IV pilus assembly protein PilM
VEFLRIFSPSTGLRPALACEIMPEGVLAARRADPGQSVMAFAPLTGGVVRPSVSAPNFTDPAAVTEAIGKALGEVAAREKALTLIVPDSAVRVLILDFDSLPAKPQDALPIVRFRLRKLTPFEVDDAAISYQALHQKKDQTRVLVTVTPSTIRSEYEDAVRAAGYEPGALLPSTLASLAALGTGDAALVVNRNGASVTTAISSGDDLLLHRTLELPADAHTQREELAQIVLVATAYFEDTLQLAPNVLYYAGLGGAEEFALVANPDGFGLQVRDLVPHAATGVVSAMPRGLSAGVTGALAV